MVFIQSTEGELEIAVTGPVLADSQEQAREAPLERETGWCVPGDGVAYVAVHTDAERERGEKHTA